MKTQRGWYLFIGLLLLPIAVGLALAQPVPVQPPPAAPQACTVGFEYWTLGEHRFYLDVGHKPATLLGVHGTISWGPPITAPRQWDAVVNRQFIASLLPPETEGQVGPEKATWDGKEGIDGGQTSVAKNLRQLNVKQRDKQTGFQHIDIDWADGVNLPSGRIMWVVANRAYWWDPNPTTGGFVTTTDSGYAMDIEFQMTVTYR